MRRIQAHQIEGIDSLAGAGGYPGDAPLVDYTVAGSAVAVDTTTGHRAFPVSITLRSGKHVTLYRSASNHAWASDGKVVCRTSSDDTATWSAASTALDTSGDDNIGGVTQARNGDVFAAVVMRPTSTLTDWYGAVIKSTDDATTWGSPVAVDGGFTSWEYPSGITALPNGNLLVAEYGQDTGGSYDYAAVSASSDGGVTWARRGVIAQSGSAHYQEPRLVVMPDGELLAFLRYESGSTYLIRLSRSTDNGATWSAPVTILSNAGGLPGAHLTRNGVLVLAYRNTPGSGGPTGLAVSFDRGNTWTTRGDFTGTGTNFVYGDWLDLSDGDIACVYALQSSLTSAAVYSRRFARSLTETGAAAGITVQDENGNVATGVTQLDFQGANVTATAGTGEVVVTIAGSASSGSSGELLMQDGVTSPPAPLETEDGSDWLYQG